MRVHLLEPWRLWQLAMGRWDWIEMMLTQQQRQQDRPTGCMCYVLSLVQEHLVHSHWEDQQLYLPEDQPSFRWCFWAAPASWLGTALVVATRVVHHSVAETAERLKWTISLFPGVTYSGGSAFLPTSQADLDPALKETVASPSICIATMALVNVVNMVS